MNGHSAVFASLFLLLTTRISSFAASCDVAAFVWPAYQPEPRWAELGIFKDGKGEWQNLYEAERREEAVGPCSGGFEELTDLPRTTLKSERTEKGVRVTNSGDKLAFFVRIKSMKDGRLVVPVHYSDNYLNLLPGEAAEVEIEGVPSGASVDVSAWNAD